jgi:hypothetical protein
MKCRNQECSRLADQRRGLCRRCYDDRSIRAKFPRLDTTEARRTNGQRAWTGTRSRPLPQPTIAVPGSREKIEVMRLRFERGEQIFHPDDPRQWKGGCIAIPEAGAKTGSRVAGNGPVRDGPILQRLGRRHGNVHKSPKL